MGHSEMTDSQVSRVETTLCAVLAVCLYAYGLMRLQKTFVFEMSTQHDEKKKNTEVLLLHHTYAYKVRVRIIPYLQSTRNPRFPYIVKNGRFSIPSADTALTAPLPSLLTLSNRELPSNVKIHLRPGYREQAISKAKLFLPPP